MLLLTLVIKIIRYIATIMNSRKINNYHDLEHMHSTLANIFHYMYEKHMQIVKLNTNE